MEGRQESNDAKAVKDDLTDDKKGEETATCENVDKVAATEDASGEEASASGSWWGGYSSWLSKDTLNKAVSSINSAVEVAKNKSTDVYDMVSKDLEEVATHANTMVRSTSTTLKQTLEEFDEKSDAVADKALDSVKSSVTSAWRYAAGYATQLFVEEDYDSEAIVVGGDSEDPVVLSRLQAQLLALSSDPETFLADPSPEDSAAADLDTWSADIDKRQGEISDLMVNNQHVRKNYSSLVPDKVTHKVFWTRYFQKVHLVEILERKRQVLKKRANEASADDDEINWDDLGDSSEIPDDMQDRLLSDYERELIGAKVNAAAADLKTELSITNAKQGSPDKDETSSEDWEKLSSGEKSPKKTAKDEAI